MNVELILESKVVQKLKHQYPDLGYFYIVSNPGWGQYLKLGETDNIVKRISSYNNSNALPTKCEYVIVCNGYKILEQDVKNVMREEKYAYKAKSN